MKNLFNKIRENKGKTIIIGIAVLLLIVLSVLFQTQNLNIEKIAFWKGDVDQTQTANVLDSDIVEVIEKINLTSKEEKIAQSSAIVIDGLVHFTKVKVPVLSDTDLFDYEGQKFGCDDEVVWIIKDVEPTPAPLNAAIRTMFETETGMFKPGNFLGTQEKLEFDEARIENGIAEIYLTGEFEVADECDAPRQFIQLEEVALQFDSVVGTQIFLNGELVR
jgi:hypothetical protein